MLSRSARALAHRRPLSLASRAVPTLVRPLSTSPVSSLHQSRQLGASPSGNDGFASGSNSFYIDSMYEEFKKASPSLPLSVPSFPCFSARSSRSSPSFLQTVQADLPLSLMYTGPFFGTRFVGDLLQGTRRRTEVARRFLSSSRSRCYRRCRPDSPCRFWWTDRGSHEGECLPL